jgi:arsenate reductase-like glutaredoxin family protein
LRKLNENGDNFQRPVIVDWNQGKAVVGDNESEILKMLKEKPSGI